MISLCCSYNNSEMKEEKNLMREFCSSSSSSGVR
jgi:hypothetical protein